ncbi:MAG TPA: hypothetical protein VMQ81_07930 [Acidimicrobiia bacterium]|nr:hypothetical protein [Acidimicrobiia bacterium]
MAAVVAVLGWGAYRLRRALLPEWSGARARLAEVVMAVGVAVGLAELLGLVGWFRRFPVLAACVVGGVGMGVVARRIGSAPSESRPGEARERERPRREEIVVAVLALAVVATQWVSHVAVSLDRGMTHYDTLWYHQPYATRFMQSGRPTDLVDRADDFHAYIAHGSELLHAMVTFPFGRDVVSPVVSLGWAALALLAAWCVGRRRDVAALSLLGAVVVLGLPMLAGTHPGQASNDVAAGALLLTAIALLLESELAPVPTALAGVAAGLALGVKLTVAGPIAVLTIGVVVLALRSGRGPAALAWCGSVAVFGCYWFGRNLAVADNPLPFWDVHLGPLGFDAAVDKPGLSIVDRINDGNGIDFLFPAYTESLGRAWPLVFALALAGAVVALAGPRTGLERLAGGAALAGAVAYPFTPLTGDHFQFAFTVRFLTPALLTGAVLLPLAVAGADRRWRRAFLVVPAGFVAAAAFARHHEGIEAWPVDHLVPGLMAGALVLGAGALVVTGRTELVRSRSVMLVAASVAVVVVGGFFVQRHYVDHRYVEAGHRLDEVYAEFRDLGDERVAVFGESEIYPLFGLDLSNRVTTLSAPTADAAAGRCRYWHDRLDDGRYRYLVVTANRLLAEQSPQPWVAGDRAVSVLVRDGDTVVYELDGTLDPDRCRAT